MNINQVYSTKICSNFNFKQSKNRDNVKVSVILPIYNQEKYLNKALKSLEKQTLEDVEFICVNDGSVDSSLNILNEYALKDERFKVINQKNQGCGASRNNGLKLAKGEYIAFLDPDDWFESNALEKLYNKAKKQDCDMVVFNFKKISEGGEVVGKFNLKERLKRFVDIKEDKNFHWRDIKSRVLGGLYPVAWNKFYKKDLIKENSLHFAKSNLAEDNVFVFGATLTARNIGYLADSLYNYQIHGNSAIRNKSDKNLCLFKSIDSVKRLLKDLDLTDELKNEFDGYIFRFVSFHSKQIKSMSTFWDVCKKKLSTFQYEMLKERHLANSKILPLLDSILRHKLK